MNTTEFIELDVRPILRAGGEPFEKIMETITTLAPDQGLRLLATFKPVPLFQVLGSKGYSHTEKAIGDGDWEVEFRPSTPIPDIAASAPPQSADAPWPGPVRQIDARDLGPPEPMVNILAAIETMSDGEVLCALLNRKPIFLLPELSKRGHDWRGGFEADGTTYQLLVHVGAVRGVSP